MRILVKKGGPLTTLQDLGRYGYQKFGVLVSGAMDDVFAPFQSARPERSW